MAIDLVPNSRNFQLEGWDFFSEEDSENMKIIETNPDGDLNCNRGYYAQLPRYIAVASLEFLRQCNGFMIL